MKLIWQKFQFVIINKNKQKEVPLNNRLTMHIKVQKTC